MVPRLTHTVFVLLSVAALSLSTAPAPADTLHVPAEYPTIQAAIDAAVDGDVVEIADGTYTGDGNKDLDFAGKAITVRSASGDPALCIIDCEHDGRGIYFHYYEGPGTLVQGLTITNGFVDDDSPSGRHGGGLRFYNSSPTIDNCVIRGSAAVDGGAVHCYYYANPTFIHCLITENSASRDGGGVRSQATVSGRFINCTFSRNTAAQRGGGAYYYWSDGGFINCVFTENRAHDAGGGFACVDYAEPTLTNSIIWGNIPDDLYVDDAFPIVTYCDIQGGWEGEGNLDVDPFVFPDDFHLVPGSPCIDAGTNEPPGGLPEDDLDGNLRPLDGDGDLVATADIGTYEYNPDAPSIGLSPSTATFFGLVNGENPPDQTLSIRNCGGGMLNWEITSLAAWLSVTPTSGEATGEVDEVTVSVDTTGLPYGWYTGALEITDAQAVNSPRTVVVTLRVMTIRSVPDEYATIQSAITAAEDGDIVEIADGIYTGIGNKDLQLGGKAITVRSASGDPALCVIDCERDGRGFYLHQNEGPDTIIEGLTITRGFVDGGGGSEDTGGGIYCENSSPTARNCVITGNVATLAGGGLYVLGGEPALIQCTIRENRAALGAGIASSGGDPALIACTICENSASNGGGGIYSVSGDLALSHCVIGGNEAAARGGGVLQYVGETQLTNCEFLNNNADREGCAIYAFDVALRSTNCTFSWNVGGPLEAAAMYCARGTVATLTNCIVWNHTVPEIALDEDSTVTATYCNIRDGWPGTGNIDADPSFAMSSDAHLMPDSPCIDAGTNTPADGLPIEDLDGNVRPLDGDGDASAIADMGAYELNPAAPSIALSLDRFRVHSPAGEPDPTYESLEIRNCGGGTLNWQVTGLPTWLTASPESGSSAGEVDEVLLFFDISELVYGTYVAVFEIVDPQATNTPREVVVELHLTKTHVVPDEYATIQAAIDAAEVDHDVIELADGTYSGPGNINLDFGGKTLTVRSASEDPATCIIDCQGNGRAFYFHHGERVGSRVEGLTVLNGVADEDTPVDDNGGAIYCTSSSPALRNCVIRNCSAHEGGGVFCDDYGGIWLNSCTFVGNTASTGGGAYFDGYSTGVMYACRLHQNSAESGGAVGCRQANLRMTNCLLTENDGGGASMDDHTRATFEYCTIAANEGTGLLSLDYSDTLATTCILWDNTPDQVFGDDTVVTFSDVQGGWPGEGNIDADPLFAFARDAHLTPGSPCIDTVPSDLLPVLIRDLDGNYRPDDGDDDGVALSDMGAYEYTTWRPSIAIDRDHFTFHSQVGGPSPAAQTLQTRNCGGEPLNWEAVSDAAWLSASPASGTASAGETHEIALIVDTSALSHGLHTAVLDVVDPVAANSPRKVHVTLYLTGTLAIPSQYPTIQAAIDAAIHGDVLELADGTYTGSGNKNLDYAGKAITVRGASGDPTACIIDCEGAGRGFTFETGEGTDSVLADLTIIHGDPFEYTPERDTGGGVHCDSSSPTIRNCIVQASTGSQGGGGYLVWSNAHLIQCRFVGNSAESGGGIACKNSNPTITDCTFEGNTATNSGGGVYCLRSNAAITACTFSENQATNGGGICLEYDSHATLTRCTVVANVAEDEGAGVHCNMSDPTITNCRISRNAAARGAAIACNAYAYPDILNCTIVNNHASPGRGGGLRCESSNPALKSCILWGNTPNQIKIESSTPQVKYCDVQDGWTGEGNLDADPLFADPDGPDDDPATWEDNDYRLTVDSPCIDAGDPELVALPGETDLDGHLRVWDGHGDGIAIVDMGAYEFGAHATGDLNCDGAVDIHDINAFVLALTSAYQPEPFENYYTQYPACHHLTADCNLDGVVDIRDINPFVTVLVEGYGG